MQPTFQSVPVQASATLPSGFGQGPTFLGFHFGPVPSFPSYPSLVSNVAQSSLPTPSPVIQPVQTNVSAAFSEYVNLDEPNMYNNGGLDVAALSFAGIPAGGDFRVTLFVWLMSGGLCFLAKALVDSGSMGDFVSSKFVNDHQVHLHERDVPLTCSTFDGSLSTGGLITHKWSGTLCIQGDDRSHFACPVDLNLTKIGNHDMILGIPWLRAHDAFVGGATPSLLINGPSKDARYLLGDEPSSPHASPPLPCHISSTSPASSSSLDSTDLPATLPASLREIADVFRPQDSFSPPLQPGYDLEVHLKPGCVPPSSCSFIFSPDEEAELRAYIDEQISKGNIWKSSSPAASPIFVVKSEGKANRPCVDYRGLNSITVRDKYPIPVIVM